MSASVNDLLDFAMAKERELHDFYADFAERAGAPALRALLLGFAADELDHLRRLERIRAEVDLTDACDLKLDYDRYRVDTGSSQDLDVQSSLILVMRRAKALCRLYVDMAAALDSDPVGGIFTSLAHQESHHKVRLELEYDDVILAEG